MAIKVHWPNGHVEEFKRLGLEMPEDMGTVILNDAEVFVGIHSCTIKIKGSTTVYPYWLIRRIVLEE